MYTSAETLMKKCKGEGSVSFAYGTKEAEDSYRAACPCRSCTWRIAHAGNACACSERQTWRAQIMAIFDVQEQHFIRAWRR